jgi:F-type H+-transporting ATPase subunit epsilon
MSTFNLRISAIRRDFYTGVCDSLVFTTLDGMVGILAGHEPTVYAVSAGELRFTVNGETQVLAVGDGMARVAGDKVVILVDFAELASEIDAIRAQEAKERAQAIIQSKNDDRSIASAEAALSRAIARLKVAKKTKR